MFWLCDSQQHASQHIIINVIRTDQGFIVQRNIYPGGPPAFFADSSQPTFVSKNSVYVVQTVLGDAVAVSRIFRLIFILS